MGVGKLATGVILGTWKLGKYLAGGGQGEVWEVRPASGARTPPRAIKVCYLPDERGRRRFEQEVRLLGSLPPNHLIVPLLDSELEWKPEPRSGLECAFYVTERFECSLERLPWLSRAPLFALRAFKELCDATEFLHLLPSPLIHRDIKPSNVLLGSEPYRVVLGDLGIALEPDANAGITKTHEVVGSEWYRAPETLMGKPADARSDVYSLGRTLEWLLTGMAPDAVVPREIPVSAALSPAARQLLTTAMRTACNSDPDARFQTVAQLKAALPEFQIEIAGARVRPSESHPARFADASTAYVGSKTILAAGDRAAWREISKRQRLEIQQSMLEWRTLVDGRSIPRTREERIGAVDEILQLLGPSLAPALASIELGRKDIIDPLQVLRDVSEIAGWNYAGVTLLAEGPRTASFLVHHLLGAMALAVHDIELVVGLAEIPLRDSQGIQRPLLRSSDVLLWPALLNNGALAWNFLAQLPSRVSWLNEIFVSEFDYLIALSAYRWQLLVLEFAYSLPTKGASQEHKSVGVLNVAPVMFKEDLDVIRRGFKMAFPNRETVVKLCQLAGVDSKGLLENWASRVLTIRESAKQDGDWKPWYEHEQGFLQLP